MAELQAVQPDLPRRGLGDLDVQRAARGLGKRERVGRQARRRDGGALGRQLGEEIAARLGVHR